MTRLQRTFLKWCDSNIMSTNSSSNCSSPIRFALVVLCVFHLALALSDRLIPDHNPGDDVLRFPLSNDRHDNENSKNNNNLSFCSIHFPDSKITKRSPSDNSLFNVSPNILQSHVYPFLLSPLTRWDAARFLTLALWPRSRWPFIHSDDNNHGSNIMNAHEQEEEEDYNTAFQQSEQLHAFLPLFPALIQLFSWLLLYLVPMSLLPNTCAQVMVLAGCLVNGLAFLSATRDIYIMTNHLLSRHYDHGYCDDDKNNNKKKDDDHVIVTMNTTNNNNTWARRVAILFILNPASVFFHTNYSEAITAALLFRGIVMHLKPTKTTKKHTNDGAVGVSVCYPIIWWTIAAFGRSNVALYAGFLLLQVIGILSAGMVASRRRTGWNLSRMVMGLLVRIVGIVLLAVGVLRWHNYSGYRKHCIESDKRPDWCQSASPTFQLYSYVQSKHWGVGFMRYWQLKQIPNFLLAAPVLILSGIAVFTWIGNSWRRQSITSNRNRSLLERIIMWGVRSLMDFGDYKTDKMESPEAILTGSPIVLGHYAVLAASALLGLFVAHVQISTRLIFSTCPALYWYLAVAVSDEKRPLGHWILMYFALYIFLGIILHPNWLPWT